MLLPVGKRSLAQQVINCFLSVAGFNHWQCYTCLLKGPAQEKDIIAVIFRDKNWRMF
jgi:hypothetical protein